MLEKEQKMNKTGFSLLGLSLCLMGGSLMANSTSVAEELNLNKPTALLEEKEAATTRTVVFTITGMT